MNLRQRVRDSFPFHLNHVPSRDDTDCLYWRLNISFLLKEIQNIFTLNYLIEIIYLDHIG